MDKNKNLLKIDELTSASKLPLIWLRPMYDDEALPDEISKIRTHFLSWGMERMSDIGHEEIWGIFKEEFFLDVLININKWENDEIAGFSSAWLILPPDRNQSALINYVLSKSHHNFTKNHITLKDLLMCQSRNLDKMDGIEHFIIPRNEFLIDLQLRKKAEEDQKFNGKIIPAHIKHKL